MDLTPRSAISPVDGRYRNQVSGLEEYFSEYALIRYRLFVEIEYFIALCELGLPQLSGFRVEDFSLLRDIFRKFTVEEALKVKDFEKVTNHDVKSVEYYLRTKFDENGLSRFSEFIHFGLTSQDINNTAIPYSVKQALDAVYYPALDNVTGRLEEMSEIWHDVPMLARTHGQPASPTRLGKEIAVFAERLRIQSDILHKTTISAKFGGATGNFNAHKAAYPEVDWKVFADSFVSERLGLERQQTTTQIEHYDNLAALFDCMKRINTILTDLNRDMWTYISLEYFKQKIKAGEVGSSVMPHKVNPIDFENSEGNLGMANAILEHLASKLPVSRLQRDLTDSTVIRNIGVPFAHTIIALKSAYRGLGKLVLNRQALENDLRNNWVVISEAIQTILRREGYPNPYNVLKNLTRTGRSLTQEEFNSFIDTLDVAAGVKTELKSITPFNYTGI
jgi:adenylosuccinate lyase